MPAFLRFSLLLINGAVAALIGGLLVFDPQTLFGLSGIELAADPNLMSEIRAPGGVLLLGAGFLIAAMFIPRWQSAAFALSALIMLGYGLARAFGIAVDGMPGPDLQMALALELVLGTFSLIALVRAERAGVPSPDIQSA